MKTKTSFILSMLVLLVGTIFFSSCGLSDIQQKSDSGVQKATIEVKTDVEGHTTEQINIMERLKRDNEIGSLKHLYVVSSFTGDVLQYSTVKGKVTSGGKRLSPKTVNGFTNNVGTWNNHVNLNGKEYTTDEVLDDGGTYGESGTYLYWFDAQNNYHQYYPSGGTYLHIADKPLRVKKANITMEMEVTGEIPTSTTTNK
jgi:hypothetical protein